MDFLTRSACAEALELKKRRTREERGRFLLEGLALIEEARQAGYAVFALYMEEEYLGDYLEATGRPLQEEEGLVVFASAQQLKRLSSLKTPAAVIAEVALPEAREADLRPGQRILVAADIQDPGNLGTMIRTAAWFGLDAVWVTEEGVDPYSAKVARATMGAFFQVPVYYSRDLTADLAALKEAGTPVLAAAMHGTSIDGFVAPGHWALLIGNEGNGLGDEQLAAADTVVAVPGNGAVESLNAAVSSAIIVYSLTR